MFLLPSLSARFVRRAALSALALLAVAATPAFAEGPAVICAGMRMANGQIDAIPVDAHYAYIDANGFERVGSESVCLKRDPVGTGAHMSVRDAEDLRKAIERGHPHRRNVIIDERLIAHHP